MTKRVYIVNADANTSVQLRVSVRSNETGDVLYAEQNANYPGDIAEVTISDGQHIRIDEVAAPDAD